MSLRYRRTRQHGLREPQPLGEVGALSVGGGPRDEAPEGVGHTAPQERADKTCLQFVGAFEGPDHVVH